MTASNAMAETRPGSSPVDVIMGMAPGRIGNRCIGCCARWLRRASSPKPSTDAFAYVLKRILHDWRDEQCVRILRCCRAAMSDRARLLVVDAVVPAGNAPHPGKVMDILMMVLGEGRERTEQEFRALFENAGLQLTTITATPSTLAIVEAIPA
jgi:hypothetical protein